MQVNVCNVYYRLCYLGHVGVSPLWGFWWEIWGWFCVAKERVYAVAMADKINNKFSRNSCAKFLIEQNCSDCRQREQTLLVAVDEPQNPRTPAEPTRGVEA